MNHPILKKIGQYAQQLFVSQYSFCGVADGTDFMMLNSGGDNEDLIVTISAKGLLESGETKRLREENDALRKQIRELEIRIEMGVEKELGIPQTDANPVLTTEQARQLSGMMEAYGEEYPGGFDHNRDQLLASGMSRDEIIRCHGDWNRK